MTHAVFSADQGLIASQESTCGGFRVQKVERQESRGLLSIFYIMIDITVQR